MDVFKCFDGTTVTYVQDTATPENSNTAVPYPWDADNPTAPYSYVTNFDGSVTSVSHQGGTGTTNDGQPYILFRYAGGSSYPITAAEAALLSGYTAHGTGYSGRIT